MYHELRDNCHVLAVSSFGGSGCRPDGPGRTCPCGGRLHAANYPRKPRGSPSVFREIQLPVQFLLRSRRLPQAEDAAVGAFPRPQGLSLRGGRAGERHAARAVAAPRPRAVQAVRRRPADHRPLAGVLAGARAATPFWKVARGRLPATAIGPPAAVPSRSVPRAATSPAWAGGGCCDFCRRSRPRGCCRASSSDELRRPAEDARRPSGRAVG